MIRVVAHERRHVEGGRETALAVGEEVTEALVRVLGATEAGELPHAPEPASIHRRVRAAGEGILARLADVFVGGKVVLHVDRIDLHVGDGGEATETFLDRVVLLQPLALSHGCTRQHSKTSAKTTWK